MAIGPKDRRPSVAHPPLQIVRFRDKMLHEGIEEHTIGGVAVPIYNVPKTVVDLFRYRQSAGKRYKKSPGLNLALEGLREALRQRKATRPTSLTTPATPESGKSSSRTCKR
jgi:hypothetical protein